MKKKNVPTTPRVHFQLQNYPVKKDEKWQFRAVGAAVLFCFRQKSRHSHLVSNLHKFPIKQVYWPQLIITPTCLEPLNAFVQFFQSYNRR